MRDYYEIIGPLRVPIGGKLYTLPPIDAATGVELKLAAEGKPSAWFKRLAPSGVDAIKLVLGGAFDEMIADGVEQGAIDQAFLAAMADFSSGRAAAERVWEAGADPEFRAALNAAAQAVTQKATKTRSTGTASAKRTRSPGSTRPTGPKLRTSPKVKDVASNGGRSSPSGTS